VGGGIWKGWDGIHCWEQEGGAGSWSACLLLPAAAGRQAEVHHALPSFLPVGLSAYGLHGGPDGHSTLSVLGRRTRAGDPCVLRLLSNSPLGSADAYSVLCRHSGTVSIELGGADVLRCRLCCFTTNSQSDFRCYLGSALVFLGFGRVLQRPAEGLEERLWEEHPTIYKILWAVSGWSLLPVSSASLDVGWTLHGTSDSCTTWAVLAGRRLGVGVVI